MTLLRKDLEAPAEERRPGSGWISGVLALVLSVIGLGAVLCLRYPDLLTMPDARKFYNVGLIRLALHGVLVASFVLGITSVVLRKNKILGFVSMTLVLLAMLLGGSNAQERLNLDTDIYFGLDWFLLDLIILGIVFIPIERLLGRKEQPIFRYEWREDLVYFLVSTLMMVHSNLRLRWGWLDFALVTPRFHHWHHGIEREAIDVNFAVHFPVFDWVFGTYHLPPDGRWPGGYGINDHSLPNSYIGQFLYPFFPRQMAKPNEPTVNAKAEEDR